MLLENINELKKNNNMKRSKDILLESSIKRQELDIIKWKCELADAILKEAEFNNTPIRIGDKIEHQLGNVWTSSIIIQIDKVIIFICVHCKKEVSSMEITEISSLTDFKCPKCKKLNKVN